MSFVIGLLIALGSLVASIVHLQQSADSYFDFVGFVMVLGGTIATALITLPLDISRQIFSNVVRVVFRPSVDRRKFIRDSLETIQEVRKGQFTVTPKGKGLHYQLLAEGTELIQLGLGAEKIEVILKERLFHTMGRVKRVALSIRSLAKYPPAFGLAGTVLGLVHLMRGVSEGMAPQETGIRMAIALIATFYGLLVANLVVNPIGEAISKNANEEEHLGELSLQAVLLAAEKQNLLESQELLNSFVEPRDRVDMISQAEESDTEALGVASVA